MAQKFWINRTFAKITTGPRYVPILIPDNCPHCSMPIKISERYPGSDKDDSAIEGTCDHTLHIPKNLGAAYPRRSY